MSNHPLEVPLGTSTTAAITTTTALSPTFSSQRMWRTVPKATSGFRHLLEQAMAPLPSQHQDIIDHTVPHEPTTVPPTTATEEEDRMHILPPEQIIHLPQPPEQYDYDHHRSYNHQHQDQPPPMIDYWRFKKRLKFFARRRCHILHILQRRRTHPNYQHEPEDPMTATSVMNFYEDQAMNEFVQPRPIHTIAASAVPMRTDTSTMADPPSQEDIYTHAPLSYNLSMDPHAHIGRGSDRTTTTTAEAAMSTSGCDYVEMKEDTPTMQHCTTTTTTFGMELGDDASHTTASSNQNQDYDSNRTNFCFYPFTTPPPTTTVRGEIPTESSTPHVGRRSSDNHQQHYPKPPPAPRRTILRKLSISERNEIVTFLEWEMDQCYMYYLSQYSALLLRYNAFQQLYTDLQGGTGDDRRIEPEFQLSNMIELGDDIIELMAYCTMNIIIAQQILIRYDALALTLEGTPMLNYYLKRVLQPPPMNPSNATTTIMMTTTSSYYKVRYHDELYQLANQFITNIIITTSSPPTSSLRTVHDDIGGSGTVPGLYSHQDQYYSNENHANSATASYTTRAYLTHFQEQMDLFRTLLDSLQQQVVPTATSTIIAKTPLTNHHHSHNTTTVSTLSSSSSSQLPESLPPYNDPSSRTATSTTSPSYWYNTLKYTLSSYYETMMRYSIKTYIQMGLFEDRLGLEPGFLSNRGQSLTKEMESIVQWRHRKQNWYTTFHNMNHHSTTIDPSQPLYYYNYYNPLYHRNGASSTGRTSTLDPCPLSPTSPSPTTTTTTEKKLSGLQIFHLTLNMLAAFLYCMNYYIVEPSSTMYVNRLGAHDAMSGTLIGMMPLAAFVSSIPYSMWTNRSFRHPFIMSSIMLIAGNLTYSFADQFGVVWIALLGRFMAGLGAPKCIIRRYMADTTPVSLRTSVNAGFGMVVAAGSAMGPAMAIVLNRFEYTCYVKHLGLVTLNGLTLPGYFMACLWLTFFVIVVLTFEEPDREGLKEQKELEAMGVIPFSPSNMGSFGVPDENDDVNPAPVTEASHNTNDGKSHMRKDDELYSVFSGESNGDTEPPMNANMEHHRATWIESHLPQWMIRIVHYSDLITLPVRICLGLLFCKVFTIEALVSSTSALTKNRYQWQVTQVGKLGFANGVMVIPFSILVGRLSMTYQDHVLMKWLVGLGCCGMFLLIDLSDLVGTPRYRYNAGHVLAVAPRRYMVGYFISYLSIQAFEGVIGSTLSKVIPTALASGTFNSGLLATLVDTFGRTCGDLFISAAGFLSLRQLMNLLFIPGFTIMLSCLIVIERCRDLLSV